MIITINSPISAVKGVGDKFTALLNKEGILRVYDLLLKFPLFYLDFGNLDNQPNPTKKKCYLVHIKRTKITRIYPRRFSLLQVWAELNQIPIKLLLFNKPYLLQFFKKNRQVYIYGTFFKDHNLWQIKNPLVFGSQYQNQIIPVYHQISTIKSGKIRQIIKNIMLKLQDDIEYLPEFIIQKNGFPSIGSALNQIHFPSHQQVDQIEKLKTRFIYSELFFFQLQLQFLRNTLKQVKRLHHYQLTQNLRDSINSSLEFELTPDQISAYEEIVNDLKAPYTMKRLLQGDVGSGKTILAFMALLVVVENGFQGAFLAPTEILANQHHQNALKFFKNHPLDVITGSTPEAMRRTLKQKVLDGDISILFGTHALLNEKLTFKNLALIVIDEQHRFGVSQRASLYYKGRAVDLLVTTATPIPRTMLLTLYNDLQVSTIKTKPSGRKPVTTHIVSSTQRIDFYQDLRTKINNKGKLFIIIPLIQDSEFFSELKSIESETPFFKDVFKGIPMGILTGKSSLDHKNKIIADFRRGKIKILISTTVIEIGIDIQDANIMVIEDADRYGLAQLHQLRGRVGRGSRQSLCFLIPSSHITAGGKERLQTMAATNNGFKIADIDLKMRGGGIISGLEQSGFLDFKIADMKKDYLILKNVQKDVQNVLAHSQNQNHYIIEFLKNIKKKLKKISFS